MDQAFEEMKGAHGVTQRKTCVACQPGIALAQQVKVGRAVPVRVAQVGDEEPHQVVPQLALACFGGVVESRVPRLSRQLAGARGEPRLTDKGGHEERKLGRSVGGQRFNVLDAETPVATRGSERSNAASIRPFPQSRRMYVQAVRRLMQAEPGGRFVGPNGHRGSLRSLLRQVQEPLISIDLG